MLQSASMFDVKSKLKCLKDASLFNNVVHGQAICSLLQTPHDINKVEKRYKLGSALSAIQHIYKYIC